MRLGEEKKGIITIVDNTLLTPYFQRPIELGADIVIHSATKYLGGHNDVLAGLIVTKGKELSERIAFLHNSIGAVLGPQDSWLLMRGMKTLALRMDRHQYNATRLAEFLAGHPMVAEVFYPALEQHPGHHTQNKQSSGNTGIFFLQNERRPLYRADPSPHPPDCFCGEPGRGRVVDDLSCSADARGYSS